MINLFLEIPQFLASKTKLTARLGYYTKNNKINKYKQIVLPNFTQIFIFYFIIYLFIGLYISFFSLSSFESVQLHLFNDDDNNSNNSNNNNQQTNELTNVPRGKRMNERTNERMNKQTNKQRKTSCLHLVKVGFCLRRIFPSLVTLPVNRYFKHFVYVIYNVLVFVRIKSFVLCLPVEVSLVKYLVFKCMLVLGFHY